MNNNLGAFINIYFSLIIFVLLLTFLEHYMELFEQVESKKILVVGDVMIDAYLWGSVNRISPEAPVPIISVTKRENRLGGAANVALNLKSLGAVPIICSVIGSDENGELYNSLMNENLLITKGIVRAKRRKTTKKTRVISDGQHLLRVDDEISYSLSIDEENLLINAIKTIVNEEDVAAIVFEDYDKGVISENLINEVTHLAIEQNIPTAVDPKKKNYNLYKNVTLFKPNFKEFVEGAKLELLKADIKGIFENAKLLIKSRDIKYVFVTLSELGVFITDGKKYHLIPAEYRQIVDVSGAGDTVISVATLLLAQGMEMKEIAENANKAGGIVCEKVGVVSITREELFLK